MGVLHWGTWPLPAPRVSVPGKSHVGKKEAPGILMPLPGTRVSLVSGGRMGGARVGVAAQYSTDQLSLAASSPAEDLFPGRRYDGGLDSGFHSVDSGSKRWSGNEVSASFPKDTGNLSPRGESLSYDPLPCTSKSQNDGWWLEVSSSFPCPSIPGKYWLSNR